VKDSSRQLYTLANFISIGRLLLLVPLYICLRNGQNGGGNLWAMVVMGIALLTDLLDGLIARIMHQVSDWGKLLDPIADKMWIGFLALFLALPSREHPLPFLFLALVIARDVAIVIAGSYAYGRTGIVLSSNWLGKVAMVCTAVTLILYTTYWTPPFLPILTPENVMWLTTVMLLLSSAVYTNRLRTLLAEATHHTPADRPLKVSS
jgi:cardiolipin synthase (CMP-forming)